MLIGLIGVCNDKMMAVLESKSDFNTEVQWAYLWQFLSRSDMYSSNFHKLRCTRSDTAQHVIRVDKHQTGVTHYRLQWR